MRLFLFFLCATLLCFLPENAQAQYWRTLTNPLYRAHTKINENQLVIAEKILNKRQYTADTLNPIYWHSRTRIAEAKLQRFATPIHPERHRFADSNGQANC